MEIVPKCDIKSLLLFHKESKKVTVFPSDSTSGVTTLRVKRNNPEIHSTSTKSRAVLSCGAGCVCEFTAGLLSPLLSACSAGVSWSGGSGACTREVTLKCFPMVPRHALNSTCSRRRNVTPSAWGTPQSYKYRQWWASLLYPCEA